MRASVKRFPYYLDHTLRDTLATLGSKYISGGGPGSLPQISVTGRFNACTMQQEGNAISDTREASGDLGWFQGGHELKFGADLMWARFFYGVADRAYGQFSVDGTFTKNAFGDFLLGQASRLQQQYRANNVRYYAPGFYVHDRWRVKRRPTFNAGSRWEIYTPWRQRYTPATAFVPGARSKLIPSAPLELLYDVDPGFPLQTDAVNVGPRVGFALDLFGNGKTSLRGGYGISYDPLVGQISAQNSPPFAVDLDTRNVGPFSDPHRYMDVPYGKPADLSRPVFPVSVTVRGSYAGKIVVTYAQNIHLNLEKQVVRDTTLQVSYVATLGRHEPTMPEQNPACYVPGASTSTNIDQRRIYAPAFTSIRNWAAAAPFERRFSRKVEPRCCSRTFGGWSRNTQPPRRRAFRRETVEGRQAAASRVIGGVLNVCDLKCDLKVRQERSLSLTPRPHIHIIIAGLIFGRPSMRMFFAASVLCGLLIATVFFVPQPAFGQAFTSSLTGLVTDPSGGAVPNAAVRIKSVATSEERQAVTAADGRYTFSQLLPGDYELTAESAGFKAHFQRGITLKASQSAAVDVMLQIGEVTQRVEIAETSVQLDTQTANQSVTLSRDMVLALPTNARNPMLLVHATAGVTAPGVGVTQATQDQNHDRFGLNGGRSTTTQVLLDGVSTTTGTGWNGLLYAPSIDSVQEVQVIRNAYDAQFGRSAGGTISMVTKGGASDFHGTAYEFLRNSAMDATTWANNRAGLKKPIFQRHQFGGNFSGPVSRAKRIFFFGNYEGLRQGTPSTSTVSLPTAAERTGDFSDTFNRDGTRSNIYNPFSTRPNPSGAGYVRDAFPNNRIPAALLDPVGVKAVALYPAPNNPGDPFTHARNYVATGKASAATDRADIRGDWAVNDKYTTYGRYSRAFRLDNNPADIWESYGGTGPIHRNRRYHVTWGNTIIPDPTWVINVLAGHGRWTEQQRSKTFGQDGTVIGLPASLVSQFDAKTIPQLYPSDYSNISHSRDLALTSRVDNLQVNGTKGKGAHNIRMGFTWESNKQTGGSIYSGDFNFSRGMTSGPTAATTSSTSGNSIASLLLGTGSGGSVQKPAKLATNRIYYGWYLQDTWRLGKRLTISPGLRYDIQKPATERFNRYNNFHYDVANPFGQQVGMNLKGGLVYLDSNNRYSWDPDYRDFAPRMGVSYKLTDRLVARAGYGIFYPTVLGSGDSTGFSASSPWVTSSGGDGINPANLFRNPFPSGLVPALGSSQGLATNLGLSAGSYQRNHPSGYSQNYSLDLQFELTKRALLEVGYAGNSGRKMNFGWGFNDNQLDPEYLKLGSALDERVPNPFFGKLTSGSLTTATIPRHRLMRRFPQFDSVSRNGQTPGGSARFDALLVKLSKQFSSGLMLLSSYQWSKGIDNVSETEPSLGGAADGIRNSRNVAIERSLSAHDIPHSLVNSVVYEMPVGRGKKFGSGMPAALDYVAGGWQVAGVVRLQSGLPIRMTAPSLISQYGFGTQLPDLADARQIPIANRVPERWFNTAAFKAPAPYTVGSAPRRVNELRADWARHADLSLMKNFRFRERVRAQFRAEFFNLTNTPQFGWPATGLGSTTFGVVSGTMNVTPRNVQLGLKIDF